MTPRDKAIELITWYSNYTGGEDVPEQISNARECAYKYAHGKVEAYQDYYGLVLTPKFRERVNQIEDFWEKVKNEIKNF